MKRISLTLGVVLMVVFAFGCAITDYDGIPGHKTTGEAKIWGKDVSFSGFGPDSDGTYSYVVSYDNTGKGNGANTIDSLRNTVVSSFNRDGLVDQDGNDVQGGGGDAGGKFLPWVTSVDFSDGTCEFDANVTQDKSNGGVGVFLCISGFEEEIDRDAELHAAPSSIGDLLTSIWSGSLTGNFTLEINGVTINGVNYPTDLATIGALAAPKRPAQFTITNGPGYASVIQAILDNTEHLAPVSFGLSFAGGMSLELPATMSVAFDHDYLWSL